MASYAEKVYANERGMIEMLGGQWRDEGGVLSGIWHGLVVHRISVVDAKTVRREFLLTEHAAGQIGRDRAKYYRRGSEPGYISIDEGRDPRPTLEAAAGAARGAAVHEIRDRGAVAAEGAAKLVDALLGAPPVSDS